MRHLIGSDSLTRNLCDPVTILVVCQAETDTLGKQF